MEISWNRRNCKYDQTNQAPSLTYDRKVIYFHNFSDTDPDF